MTENKKINLLKQWPFLQGIIDAAKVTIQPSQIILFGSRARGDAAKNSDFDLLFDTAASTPLWARFVVDLRENGPTLYNLDLIRMSEASDAMKSVIKKDGVVIYDSREN